MQRRSSSLPPDNQLQMVEEGRAGLRRRDVDRDRAYSRDRYAGRQRTYVDDYQEEYRIVSLRLVQIVCLGDGIDDWGCRHLDSNITMIVDQNGMMGTVDMAEINLGINQEITPVAKQEAKQEITMMTRSDDHAQQVTHANRNNCLNH